jgi:hypothetical protein
MWGVKLGGFARFVARVRHLLSGSARTQSVEDEVRFQLLKGLVH